MSGEEPASCWGADPERIDPDDYPPGSPFARQITWAQCLPCNIQVHLPVTQLVYAGLACPQCGARLLTPPAAPEEWVRRVLREEDALSSEL
jgi:DNA-directed RNA polymerase subunit RPC12/RpoP